MKSILGYATNCHNHLGNNLVQIHKQYNENTVKLYVHSVTATC